MTRSEIWKSQSPFAPFVTVVRYHRFNLILVIFNVLEYLKFLNICYVVIYGKSNLTLCFQRPKTGDALCKECFFWAFETEIHNTILKGSLFKRGDTVAVAASGGKDSTVLAYILKLLNERHDYGLKLVLLSVDEGITGKNLKAMLSFQNLFFICYKLQIN